MNPARRKRSLRQRTLFILAAILPLTGRCLDAGTGDESTFLSGIRQLTFDGKRAGEGYFSPDGKALIFQSERDADNPFYQIFLLNLESGETHRVSPGSGKTTCSFIRPGSDEVLFASTHLDPEARQKEKQELEFRATGQQKRYSWDYDETMDLFSAHRDGSQCKPLTRERGYDAEGAYSPDGKLIVFSSNRHAYAETLSDPDRKRLEADKSYFCELYLMNADGSGVRRLTRQPGYDGGPFFSPDGARIIWRRFDESGVIADVFTMNLDGSDVRQLTDFGCMSWAPYYHPSGRYFIFTANKLGFANFELFIADVDGSREPVRVTFTDGFDGLPVFAPEGNRLCWTANRTGDQKSQLFMAKWNHEAALKALAAAPPRQSGKASNATATTSPAAHLAPATEPPASTAATRPAAATSPALLASDLRLHVEYLASAELEGRATGTSGTRKTADYIIQQFQAAGIGPIGSDFRQPFEFTAGIKPLAGKNNLSLAVDGSPATAFETDKDFRPLSFTTSGSVDGDVVFAGYGLTVPEGSGRPYNSYASLDVSNKIVLVLRYVPEDVEPKRRQELNVYAGLRYKAMMARQRGAKALLVVTGPNSPNAGQLAPLTFDTSLSGSGLVAASITEKVAAALLAPSGKDLKALQSGLDTENPHADGGFALPKVKVSLSTGVEQIRQSDHNVLGLLPPAPGGPAEYVLIGAHYDHLGHGEGRSLERSGEEGRIHHGADDNASGVAAVLELASNLAAEHARSPHAFKRGVLFGFWSGEEIGLIGSTHFAEHPPIPLTNIVAYVNFDMVGRLRDDKLTLQGVGSSSVWRKLVEKRNVAAGFSLTLQDDPYVPTDVTAIYPKGIPVLHCFTGSHEDYHRPTDTAEKINYEGLERIATFTRGVILDLSNGDRPDYLKVSKTETGGGGRETLRAYLGTIPDYAQEVQGVKLSGVRGGAPAEKAGLKGGDIIVEFGGQKISNIYEYTYAMDAVKIGKPVQVVVQRDAQRLTFTVTPEARK